MFPELLHQQANLKLELQKLFLNVLIVVMKKQFKLILDSKELMHHNNAITQNWMEIKDKNVAMIHINFYKKSQSSVINNNWNYKKPLSLFQLEKCLDLLLWLWIDIWRINVHLEIELKLLEFFLLWTKIKTLCLEKLKIKFKKVILK